MAVSQTREPIYPPARALLLLGLFASGCTPGAPLGPEVPPLTPTPTVMLPEPRVSHSLEEICARDNHDPIATSLCGSPRPRITRLTELLDAVGLGEGDARSFAATGNSTSLVAKFASPLNPRVVIFSEEGLALNQMRAAGFLRGEQFVELMGYDPVKSDLNLYLLRFRQACNDKAEGCGLSDLVTPSIEQDWTSYTLAQDRDLVNTPEDCLICHQPKGPGSKKVPRMQEIIQPWMHWFPARQFTLTDEPDVELTESHRVVGGMFLAAHEGEERYAGIRIEHLLVDLTKGGIDASQPMPAGPNELETFVQDFSALANTPVPDLPGDFAPNPSTTDVPFDPGQVLRERDAGLRDTWASYDKEVGAARRIPVPFYDIDTTDPVRRAATTEAYRMVRDGLSPQSAMLDPRDVFSEAARDALNQAPRRDRTAVDLLARYCGRCHNERLDQTVSRARFRWDGVAKLDPSYREAIIARLNLPDDHENKMPPARFSKLPAWAIDALSSYLRDPK